MSRFKCCIALAALVLVGCASAPSRTAIDERPQAPLDPAAMVAVQGGETVAEVDLNDIDPGSVVTCREMLKTGSNVIVRYCLTQDDWRRFARRQEREAQEMLRVMQGGAYR